MGQLGVNLFQEALLHLPLFVVSVRGVDLIPHKPGHIEVFQRFFQVYIVIFIFRVILGRDVISLVWVGFVLNRMHGQKAIVTLWIGQALLVAEVVDEFHLAAVVKELLL